MEKVNIIDSVVTTENSRKIVRVMIPLLIRWAKLGLTNKTYGDVNKVLGYERFSGIGHQLYSIQNVIDALAEKFDREIPTLNCLVKNASTMLPSEGFEFVSAKYNDLDDAGKRMFVAGLDSEAVNYPYWDWVLTQLELKPISLFCENELKAITGANLQGGGEGEEHKKIKEYVYNHPESLGIEGVINKKLEHLLPSGDRLDVYFETEEDEHIAIEIKPSTSPEQDTFRGIFQCVKYQAVMDSYRAVDNGCYTNSTILVCAGSLRDNQKLLAEELGIEIWDNFEMK